MPDNGKKVVKRREFMTTWFNSSRPRLEAWSDRNKANLTGSGTSTRHVPLFRAFDLLKEPHEALVLLENDDHRIGVESVCGAQPLFSRHVDFDTVYFQFAGSTSFETEFGEYRMAPGDLMMIPEGIAHRSTGTADSLRWFVYANEPFTEFMSDRDEVSETEFEVRRLNGPSRTATGRADSRADGSVQERIVAWGDRPDDRTVVERDYDYLVGASSTDRDRKTSGIRKIRAFDVFHGIAGVRGGVEPIFRSPYLEIKTYNVVGEQFAFHRALRSEEVRIQFRGNALDMSEIENVRMKPGDATVIPRGIAHSVETDPPEDETFLRLNIYSALPWRYPHDLRDHAYDSSFEVHTTTVRTAPWRSAAE